ncbi:Transposase domain [Caloranaerobacter azorensis DSM 13643]|uniref:Transposase domain n=1 Tax=Caloranaerobacter azorensis DSM 13643 TaxID=1121264 RepID=A0A1M5RH65_9FIRM|nr:transposase [Caloranaerobacter azorensis]SHH25143.1 Transposase domain [Caloranaerobacter azorensis DSM 13643]
MNRYLVFECIKFFTSTHKSNFYPKLFDVINLSDFHEYPSSKYSPKRYPRHTLFRVFVVMKCEKFSHITQLIIYLNNNLYIAYLYGFDIMKPLHSYWTFERFIKNFIKNIDNKYFSNIIKNLVLRLKDLSFIDNSFVSADVMPVFANTKLNNPIKSFAKNKFDKANPLKSDKDCKLGVYTASNSYNKKIYTFRTKSKKYNSKWKNLNLEKAFVKNIKSVSNLNTSGHICLLALALATIKDSYIDKIKSLMRYKKLA